MNIDRRISFAITVIIFFAMQPVLTGYPVLCALWVIIHVVALVVFIIKVKRRKR